MNETYEPKFHACYPIVAGAWACEKCGNLVGDLWEAIAHVVRNQPVIRWH